MLGVFLHANPQLERFQIQSYVGARIHTNSLLDLVDRISFLKPNRSIYVVLLQTCDWPASIW